MLEAANTASDAGESGRHNVLIECGKRERQQETAERQSQLAVDVSTWIALTFYGAGLRAPLDAPESVFASFMNRTFGARR
jgi:hypothetical protein